MPDHLLKGPRAKVSVCPGAVLRGRGGGVQVSWHACGGPFYSTRSPPPSPLSHLAGTLLLHPDEELAQLVPMATGSQARLASQVPQL